MPAGSQPTVERLATGTGDNGDPGRHSNATAPVGNDHTAIGVRQGSRYGSDRVNSSATSIRDLAQDVERAAGVIHTLGLKD